MSEERLVKAVDLDVRTGERAESRTRVIAATALAVAVVTGALLVLELLRPVHGIDRGARAAIETAIAAAAILTGRLLIETADGRPRLRELLLALGVFALAVAGFSYWAGSVVAGAPQAAFGGLPISHVNWSAHSRSPRLLSSRRAPPSGRLADAPESRRRLGAVTIAAAIILADALAASARGTSRTAGTLRPTPSGWAQACSPRSPSLSPPWRSPPVRGGRRPGPSFSRGRVCCSRRLLSSLWRYRMSAWTGSRHAMAHASSPSPSSSAARISNARPRAAGAPRLDSL